MSDIDALNTILNILYEHDNRELAFELVRRFGDARGVFLATREELLSVEGVTERVAAFFNAIGALRRQAYLRYELDLPVVGRTAAKAFARAFCLTDVKPAELAIYLDGNFMAVAAEKLAGKELAREIVAGVCRTSAKRVIWLRYNPRGRDTKKYIAARRAIADRLAAPLDVLGVEFVFIE